MESQYDGGEHSDALCVLPCRSPLTLDLMQQLSACGRFGRSLAKEDQTFIVISGTDIARRMGAGCQLWRDALRGLAHRSLDSEEHTLGCRCMSWAGRGIALLPRCIAPMCASPL